MDYIQLGHTDLRVSRLAFGTWSLGGDWGAMVAKAGFTDIRIEHEPQRILRFWATKAG